ncbi:L-aspartate oxidase [Mesorhizobium sp. M2D.F.Ca.ET.185.01.1.1]|uniref:L-aspartate oxidase n=1 Tax=unclassified Mesorhizobium TaxID=325217 RepID=UPI000FC9E8B1|nr:MULTISPECIES: L-aspartate oxidase [unclassified Mesorhizobium]TGP77412.1 L-aspartate oxidase [bacterium M00.F.Ca.ET.227.01.1.1]TGP93207.1 L-aspartate oxidase [bacterium M00.F.Ca.ET.222.01.1.1]TGP96753.1 L-aspartate oxidase [bacterium M00.F.Ca.ET.221.01.1.1]TGT96086.1 L-aspartate oxidase [bacterium M00.F.Ca.ET.163.01.1.1]TGU21170.1 L-aspartate oxidase [bacterium M00.F.Ca.ET.156.01.1.1]TGU49965.1 L-aspartate oxidase [bacterium M00.F.Ca.ET.146.01.1.1]TGV68830.1 L-aspartate oxidase [Mesorhizo
MTMHNLHGRPVIVGGGIAGLMAALHLAPEPVVLVSKTALGDEASSVLAQGGIAASLGSDDSPDLHLADTLAAGDGLCDEVAARRVVEAAPQAIEHLARLGVAFDQALDGTLLLGLEAAHSRRRIVHAGGDATGRELVRALAAAVQKVASIAILEGVEVRRLLVEDGAIVGVLAVGNGEAMTLSTGRVVLATGGIGGLFDHTTNPLGSFGQGLALAARAGAELADLEFVQFHPTALDGSRRPMPLVSEAVRGEGAVLVDERSRRFLADTPAGELAPRDIVARSVWRQFEAGHRVFLDARRCLGPRFARRFPAIASLCREAGIDPAVDPIPVRPAAHYHMGGVAVDAKGRSSLRGLWACGEVARTGLHGANRLASNSLVEAVVCAASVAASVAASPTANRRPKPAIVPPRPDASRIRPIVSHALGIERNGQLLREAAKALAPIVAGRGAGSDPALVALMITIAALRREESRGSHFRIDFPWRDARSRSLRLTMDETLEAAAILSDTIPETATLLDRRA